jgi:hypothetical protein
VDKSSSDTPEILYDLVCRTSSLDGLALDAHRGHRVHGIDFVSLDRCVQI